MLSASSWLRTNTGTERGGTRELDRTERWLAARASSDRPLVQGQLPLQRWLCVRRDSRAAVLSLATTIRLNGGWQPSGNLGGNPSGNHMSALARASRCPQQCGAQTWPRAGWPGRVVCQQERSARPCARIRSLDRRWSCSTQPRGDPHQGVATRLPPRPCRHVALRVTRSAPPGAGEPCRVESWPAPHTSIRPRCS
jgi:hypothetical protein